jgi:hypothetical protein
VSRFAVVVPVGPGTEELRRFRDLLDSLWAWETGARLCVAIDASPYARNVVPGGRSGCRFVTLHAPFRGQGLPLGGRLSASLLVAFEIVRRQGPFDFILRADTDALIVGRFRDAVSRFLAGHPRTGMLGTLGFTCRRESPWYGCEKAAVSDVALALSRMPRNTPAFARIAPGWARIEAHYRAACRNGYAGKEYCQGGIYALPFRTLEQMAYQGCLDHPADWLPFAVPEDVMMGVLTRAVGLECTDFSLPGQPFGSNALGLAYSPRQLLRRRYALIHSVKSDRQYSERMVRGFFRARRQALTI